MSFLNDLIKMQDCANTGNTVWTPEGSLIPRYMKMSQAECKVYLATEQNEKEVAELKKKQEEHAKEYAAKQAAYDKEHKPEIEAQSRKATAACKPFAYDLAAKYNVGKPSSVHGNKGGVPNVYYCTIVFKGQNVYGMQEQHFAVFTVNTANG